MFEIPLNKAFKKIYSFYLFDMRNYTFLDTEQK